MLCGSALAQEGSYLKGKVLNEKGIILTGASIMLSDSSLGVSSDENGLYQMSLDPGNYELTIRFLGYQVLTQNVKISEGPNLRNFTLKPDAIFTKEVVIEATRAGWRVPLANSTIDRKTIEARNLGQDVPYVLEIAPSVYTTSDAGNGVGYTSMSIRGSDATRINVTINGIPYNDSESQQTYWVDIPDILANTRDIQIQRGVGTSTNGSSAFGGSVNLNTTRLKQEPYAIYNGTYGSFNTHKNSLAFGTGLLENGFSVDGRFSKTHSDGFIDRASSDLASYYLGLSWYGENTSVQFVNFYGYERTYQAWYGVPESYADTNRTYNPYDYKDQVDDYIQNHFQLHLKHSFSNKLTGQISLHATPGRGYWEEYLGTEYNQQAGSFPASLSAYGFEPAIVGNDTVDNTNLIQRRQLDNMFYGTVFALNYDTRKLDLTFGGGWNQYDGDHFGEVIWAEFAGSSGIYDRFYESNGLKTDFNTYIKGLYTLNKLTLFGDLQYRMVDYNISGIDWVGSGLRNIDTEDRFDFINPKAGILYQLNTYQSVYGSVAIGNREPVRADYVNAEAGVVPKAESMIDYEFGFKRRTNKYVLNLNAYYMQYTDQLVNTGRLNQDGYYIRENVAESYRAGIELEMAWKISNSFNWQLNGTFSQNQINNYTQFIDDWTTGEQIEVKYENTPLALSPNFIGASVLSYNLKKGFFNRPHIDELTFNWYAKYVGNQYLDNTGLESSKLEGYFTNDLQLVYSLNKVGFESVSFNVMVKNVANQLYSTKGWIYRFQYNANDWDPSADDIYTTKESEDAGDGNYRQMALFPFAGTQYLVGVTLHL